MIINVILKDNQLNLKEKIDSIIGNNLKKL